MLNYMAASHLSVLRGVFITRIKFSYCAVPAIGEEEELIFVANFRPSQCSIQENIDGAFQERNNPPEINRHGTGWRGQ